MNPKHIIIILLLLMCSGTASAAWLSGWDHRMEISINNTGDNLTYHRYDRTIDTASLVATGKMNANGSDCRITSATDVLQEFWNETPFNSSTTKLRINATSLGNVTNTTHYFYYGKSDASSVADGDATFPFFTDSNHECWINLSTPPFSKADQASAIIGDVIYIIGGYNNTASDPRSEMWAYNTTNDSYAQKASLTYARWGCAATELNGKIYVFGGNPSVANGSKCEMYTPGTNSWTTKGTAVPSAIYEQGLSVITYDGFIYLYRNDHLYKYNATADSYTLLNTSPPQHVINWATMSVKDGIIYIIGGFYNYAAVDHVLKYNISSDLWATGTSMPIAVYGCVRENPIIDDIIYVLQGQRVNGEFYSRFWMYNTTADTWETGKIGLFDADGVSGGVINSKIYTFCGRRDTIGPYGTAHAAVLDTTKTLEADWIDLASGNWIYSASGLTSGNLQYATNAQLRSVYTTSDNVAVVAKLKYTAGSANWGGVCTYTNAGSYASSLTAYLCPYIDIGTSNDKIYRENGGSFTLLGSSSIGSVDTWHTYIINHNATHIELIRDDAPIITVTDNTYRSGYVQILKNNITNLYIDFVYLSEFVDAVPTTSLGAEENAPTGAAATYSPPTPTTLANTTGNFWVHHTWSAGAGGNVTDSYNVSVNTVWHNTSPAYYNNTGLSAHAWSNITVYAFNSSGTGTLSSGNISQNTQVSSTPSKYIPPDPINIINNTGSDWIKHLWDAGTGNVTDSYNVCVNNIWYNGSINAYYQKTYTSDAWQNITVFAYNNSAGGTLSLSSISQNTFLEYTGTKYFSKLKTMITGIIPLLSDVLLLVIAYIPVLIGIVMVGFIMSICIGVFGKLKRW